MDVKTLSPTRILMEFIVLLVAIYGAWYGFTEIVYPAWGLEGDAPVPARTIIAVLLIALFLRTSGMKFSDIGFLRPSRIWVIVLLAILLLGLKLTVFQEVVIFLTKNLKAEESDYAFFQHLRGNELALAAWLTIAWTTAAFGEEIFFRGYLIQRITALFGGTTLAVWAGVIGQSLLFGIGHAYQGPVGIVGATMSAFLFGSFYILSSPLTGGRNLWPLIIAHGIWDTLGITLIYLNGTPNTG